MVHVVVGSGPLPFRSVGCVLARGSGRRPGRSAEGLGTPTQPDVLARPVLSAVVAHQPTASPHQHHLNGFVPSLPQTPILAAVRAAPPYLPREFLVSLARIVRIPADPRSFGAFLSQRRRRAALLRVAHPPIATAALSAGGDAVALIGPREHHRGAGGLSHPPSTLTGGIFAARSLRPILSGVPVPAFQPATNLPGEFARSLGVPASPHRCPTRGLCRS